MLLYQHIVSEEIPAALSPDRLEADLRDGAQVPYLNGERFPECPASFVPPASRLLRLPSAPAPGVCSCRLPLPPAPPTPTAAPQSDRVGLRAKRARVR